MEGYYEQLSNVPLFKEKFEALKDQIDGLYPGLDDEKTFSLMNSLFAGNDSSIGIDQKNVIFTGNSSNTQTKANVINATVGLLFTTAAASAGLTTPNFNPTNSWKFEVKGSNNQNQFVFGFTDANTISTIPIYLSGGINSPALTPQVAPSGNFLIIRISPDVISGADLTIIFNPSTQTSSTQLVSAWNQNYNFGVTTSFITLRLQFDGQLIVLDTTATDNTGFESVIFSEKVFAPKFTPTRFVQFFNTGTLATASSVTNTIQPYDPI